MDFEQKYQKDPGMNRVKEHVVSCYDCMKLAVMLPHLNIYILENNWILHTLIFILYSAKKRSAAMMVPDECIDPSRSSNDRSSDGLLFDDAGISSWYVTFSGIDPLMTNIYLSDPLKYCSNYDGMYCSLFLFINDK